MKDIYELYSQHTSIKLLKKLDAVEKLNKYLAIFYYGSHLKILDLKSIKVNIMKLWKMCITIQKYI